MRFIFTLCVSLFVGAAAVADTTGQITVSGEGRIAVAPDMARISLGVTHQAASAAEAVAMMSADMRRVLERLDAAGIAPEDIQTSSLRLDPQIDYGPEGRGSILGYTARTDVNVAVRQLDDLGGILDTVLSDGANQMGGLQFDVADRAPHLEAARIAAVADARAKAETFAQAAQAGLGPLIAINEGGASAPPMPMMEAAMSRSDVPVAAGEITVTAKVTVIYALTD